VQNWKNLLSQPKDRKIAALLALAGTVSPIAGWHKFYLQQPVWGVVYLLLSWTPIPRVASGIEAIWYLFQDGNEFNNRFNPELPPSAAAATDRVAPEQVSAVADALRQLDQLRADGLLSEYEFEQKRRQLLDRIA